MKEQTKYYTYQETHSIVNNYKDKGGSCTRISKMCDSVDVWRCCAPGLNNCTITVYPCSKFRRQYTVKYDK